MTVEQGKVTTNRQRFEASADGLASDADRQADRKIVRANPVGAMRVSDPLDVEYAK